MTSRQPQVSIGIPVYNGENYLRAALDCLLGQTFADFELIISDNASTDSTADICREYAARDKRIRYFRQETNRGIAWNYNATLQHARGQYFKWAAHDDLCDPTFLARSVEVLDADPSVVLCYSKFVLIDSKGNRIGSVNSGEDHHGAELPASKPHERYLDVLMHCVCATEMYGLIRADVLRKTGLFRPYCQADKVLIAELSLRGRIYEIPEVLFFWRQHEQQYTQLTSASEQALATNPLGSKRFALPYRTQSTLGYFAIIWRARLGIAEKARCLLVFMRYLLQIRKWRRVIKDAITGRKPWGLPVSEQSVTAGR